MLCPQCRQQVSGEARSCPRCGASLKAPEVAAVFGWRGFEWKSQTQILGWPLIHVAIGRDKKTGRLLTAKGIVAIGQFGVGVITIAQFGIGLLFGLGQFIGGVYAVGQFALGIQFGLGQFAAGQTAVGQFACGRYVLAQAGVGEHVWSAKRKDPAAHQYFEKWWRDVISHHRKSG